MAQYTFTVSNMEKLSAEWKAGIDFCLIAESMQDDNVSGWLMRKAQELFRDSEYSFFTSRYNIPFRSYLKLWELSFSNDDGKISLAYWPDAKMYLANRRFKGKPGKVLRKIFPGIDDVTLQLLVDDYQKTFDASQFQSGIAKTPEEISEIYKTECANFQNPATDFYRKSLANSCMGQRYNDNFYHLEKHPSHVYGSGDFELHYIKSDGLLAARVLVCVAKCGEKLETPKFAPIYGVSELSLNTLESRMESIGATRATHGDFDGARIIATRHKDRDDILIMPYFDIETKNVEYSRGDDFGIISRRGGFAADSTSGTSCGCKVCEHCEDTIGRHDSAYEHGGQVYCDECFSDLYFFCDGCNEAHERDDESSVDYYSYCPDCYSRRFRTCDCCDESHPRDESRSVYVLSGSTRIEQTWCESCFEDEAAYCTDENCWPREDCEYSESADVYISPQGDSDYFQSDWDCEWYESAIRCQTNDGDSVSETELLELGWIERNGIWYDPDTIDPDAIEPDSDSAAPNVDALALAVWESDGGHVAPYCPSVYYGEMQLPCAGMDSGGNCRHDSRQCDGNGIRCRYGNGNQVEPIAPRNNALRRVEHVRFNA